MKKCKLLLLALGALLLAGCSLARAEDGGAARGDRWAGFYVVRSQSRDLFYENPHLTEYGENTLHPGEYGNISIPRRVLLAEKDGESYVFPGMEGGYSLFCIQREDEHGSITEIVSNMGPADTASVHVSDAGTENYISGTIYEGPPAGAADWDAMEHRAAWTAYRVFQTADGQVYLDGSGNGYGGGGSSFTETQTYSYARDGETAEEEALTAKVYLKAVPRLEKLVVTQFDQANAVIRSDDLTLRKDMPEMICEAEASWVLVEEVHTDGTVHTAYDIPAEDGEAAHHDFVLLDGDGVGTAGILTIRAK